MKVRSLPTSLFPLVTAVLLACALSVPVAALAVSAPALQSSSLPSPSELESLISGPSASPASAGEAVAGCRRIAAEFDDRDIARFLFQYGRALAATGDPGAASVMLARTFILFPESRWSPAALLASAKLHREALDDETAAAILARRAAASARAMGLAALAAEAESFIAAAPPSLPPSTPQPTAP